MLKSHAGQLRTQPPAPAPPLHLHLVGRGVVGQLKLEEGVRNLTTLHFNQRYPEYYEQVGGPDRGACRLRFRGAHQRRLPCSPLDL